MNDDLTGVSAVGVLRLPKALIAFREVISTKSGLLRLQKRFMDKVMPEPNTGCWIWTAHLDSAGYGRFNVGREGIELRSHRVSFELFNYPIVHKMHVCHTCDNPYCVSPTHLFLGTIADNMHDRDKKGRCQRGQNHFRAKLTEVEVRIIRDAYVAGFKVGKIADYFGIHNATISQILSRKLWKHI